MKSRKIILLIVFLLGVLGLLLMASFNTPNACEYANSNMEYVKTQTETALTATEHQLSIYYAYKAINGIEKTHSNFKACGCEEAIVSLNMALDFLKNATKSKNLDDSNIELQKALTHIKKGIKELESFGLNNNDVYGDNTLVLNTKDILEAQGGILLPEGKILEKQIHDGLKNFEISIENIVNQVECNEAKSFINKTHWEAVQKLLDTSLTRPKKIYHQRVKTITQDALDRLNDCN